MRLDSLIPYPRSLGDDLSDPKPNPTAVGPQSWGSLHFIIFPGLQSSDISGPGFQIPQHSLLAGGSQGRSSCEKLRQGTRWGDGHRHLARELGRKEPLPGAHASRSAGELQAATPLPVPSSSAGGQLHCCFCVCVLWSWKGWENPSSASKQAQK